MELGRASQKICYLFLPEGFQLKPYIGLILVQLLRIMLFTFSVTCIYLYDVMSVNKDLYLYLTLCCS